VCSFLFQRSSACPSLFPLVHANCHGEKGSSRFLKFNFRQTSHSRDQPAPFIWTLLNSRFLDFCGGQLCPPRKDSLPPLILMRLYFPLYGRISLSFPVFDCSQRPEESTSFYGPPKNPRMVALSRFCGRVLHPIPPLSFLSPFPFFQPYCKS